MSYRTYFTFQTQRPPGTAPQQEHGSPTVAKTGSASLSLVRSACSSQKLSPGVQDIICKSWRTSTSKQYSAYLQKWQTFCLQEGLDPVFPNTETLLNFLYSLYVSGLGYSAINTAKSAVTSLSNISTGALKTQLISRFMKGIFNDRPALPRYQHTWDINLVLSYLDTLPLCSLDDKQLTLKTVMLLALLSGQ